MPSSDPRIDAYIDRAEPFARSILHHVRALVHEACPDVEETIKWGMPTFVHAGRLLGGMAAFKRHASFGFWQHALVVGGAGERVGMGSFGKLASVEDLPPRRTLLALIRKAARLNETGAKATPAPRRARPPLQPPDDLLAALREAPAALATFEAFSPSHRREYVEWVLEARREQTRRRRIAEAVAWLGEGKPRHWKYHKG
ncbi:MAG: hypothetical protein DI564_05660 [Rhodanobacter denitrificans]|uniref:YdhG-like domain-containing protein n=1 Tax=Rhodanobacter denitrificans TaxID=666685 RepID=A0A2W5MYF7_9GAMM|nr:MAG: hypothetical protein DI564_05660 [Rhodanobacter denitrificans]